MIKTLRVDQKRQGQAEIVRERFAAW